MKTTLTICFELALLNLVSAPRLPMAAEQLPEAKVYVSLKGKDNNSGLQPSKPLKTIERALAIARDLPTDAPRAIVLADGLYQVDEPIQIKREDYSVTIRAANKGKAILSGSVPVKGWAVDPLHTNLLCATLPFKADPECVYMMFANNEPCQLACYPEKGRLHYTAKASEGERHWLKIDAAEYPDGFDFKDLDLTSVWTILPQEWATTRSFLDEIDVEGGRLHMRSESGMPLGQFNQGYSLLNAKIGLTRPGTWMYESARGRVYYYPKPDEDPKTLDCRITSARCVFIVNNVNSAFTLDGLVIEGCRVPFVTPNVWSAEPLCAAVSVKCSRRVTVANCEIRNTAGDGVTFLKADGCKVLKSHIHHLGASAVNFQDGGVGNVEISGCELDHGGILSASSAMLYLQISNVKTVGNHIHDAPGNGAVMWSWNSLFADNHIHHVMQVQRDGGGLYGGYNWTLVKGNNVHDTYGWPCLYADEGSQHTDFTGNRCVHWWPTHAHCTRFITITNNYFTCPGGHRFSFQGSGGGVFANNKLELDRNVKEGDYLSLEACTAWKDNEVLVKNGKAYKSIGRQSMKAGAKDPADSLFATQLAPGADPFVAKSFATAWNKALYPSQLAAGGSMCGCPHTQVKAAWDATKVYFRFSTQYNALVGYFACRNETGHVWGHWDGSKLVFENGLEVEVYPDGFARSNRPEVTFTAGDTAHSKDYRNSHYTVAIPLSALGIANESAADKPVKFNVCCHNEDHRISAWGWHPQGKNVLTGRLEFLQ